METEKKLRISPAAMVEVKAALSDYVREVLRAGLGPYTTNLYVDKADYFVRWLNHEFTPGSRRNGL